MQKIRAASLIVSLILVGAISASQTVAEVRSGEPTIVKVTLSNTILPTEYSSLRRVYRGWSYLAQKLGNDGIGPEKIYSIYGSPQIPRFSQIYFGLNPKEHPSIYSGYSSKSRLKLARDCFNKNKEHLQGAEDTFKVPKEVVASIIFIETSCGKVTGREQVVHRLSRLASVADPDNMRANFEKLFRQDKSVKFEQVAARARYLEDTFYPEIQALIKISEIQKISVFDIRGSSAGAFGISQFLPSSYLRYGVDGDRDQSVSLSSIGDAIWSTANFLAGNGWDASKSEDQNRAVLWHYNRSDSYGEAVIKLSKAINGA